MRLQVAGEGAAMIETLRSQAGGRATDELSKLQAAVSRGCSGQSRDGSATLPTASGGAAHAEAAPRETG